MSFGALIADHAYGCIEISAPEDTLCRWILSVAFSEWHRREYHRLTGELQVVLSSSPSKHVSLSGLNKFVLCDDSRWSGSLERGYSLALDGR